MYKLFDKSDCFALVHGAASFGESPWNRDHFNMSAMSIAFHPSLRELEMLFQQPLASALDLALFLILQFSADSLLRYASRSKFLSLRSTE